MEFFGSVVDTVDGRNPTNHLKLDLGVLLKIQV